MRWPWDDTDDFAEVEADLEEMEQAGWTTNRLLVKVLRSQRREREAVMASLQDIVDAVDQDKAAVEAAAARVTADLGSLSAQVQSLQDQINAGGAVTAADLDAVKSSIDAVTGEAGAIDAPPAP